jgi:hypothetical protein
VHVRYLCIALFIMSHLSCLAFLLRNHICFIPMFSLVILRNFCRYLCEWQKKHVGRLLFCLGNSKPLSPRSGLLLPYMLGLDIFFSRSMFLLFFCLNFFSTWKKNKKTKIGGEDANFLFFLLIAFKILHVFLLDISIHCSLIEYAYI